MTKFITPMFYSAAIGVSVSKGDNWKIIAGKAVISFLSTRAGRSLAYDVVFK